jgi:DNA polymerase III delta subunit
MLFVFYGSDQEKAEAKFKTLTSALKSKNPNATWFVWDENSFDIDHFQELIFSQVLFGNHYGISARRLLGQTEVVDFLMNNLRAVIDSPNIFILLETSVPKNLIDAISKTGGQVKEFKLSKPAIKNNNRKPFALIEALGVHDRQRLWLEITKELAYQVPPEEIFWQLIGAIKNIYLIKTEVKSGKLKFHPYYQKKLSTYANQYKAQELIELNSKLGELLYRSRLGEIDLGESLELWAITI